MSSGSGSVRRVSREDIRMVQNLIERCLQLYMNQKEVMETLLALAKIEPRFTQLVWQKLEEENREFFRAYHLRLMVKRQIVEFNQLLQQQVHLMSQIHQAGVASIPNSNGSHVPPLHQTSACCPIEHTGPPLKPENMHHSIGTGLPNTFTDGGQTRLYSAVAMSSQVKRIDAPPNMLNRGMIQPEVGYSGSSPFMFGSDGNVLKARLSIGDSSVASVSRVESISQIVNEPFLDADDSSFEFLDQISEDFCLSDLTAEFANSSDIMATYPGSAFLATDTENLLDAENLLDSLERENQGA